MLEDYRRYRQLAAEQREEKKAELEALAKKFSITCQSSVSLITTATNIGCMMLQIILWV